MGRQHQAARRRGENDATTEPTDVEAMLNEAEAAFPPPTPEDDAKIRAIEARFPSWNEGRPERRETTTEPTTEPEDLGIAPE